MENRVCTLCKNEKPLYDFYVKVKTPLQYMSKCKECSKKISRDKWATLSKNKEWAENYKLKNRHNKSKRDREIKYYKRFPEKLRGRNYTQHMSALVEGNHLHHWSYNYEHLKDVIELIPKIHCLLHRCTVYDQERMMYRIAKTGELLDTKESHLKFIDYCIEHYLDK